MTIAGPALAAFPWQGYDHWFRLFVPREGQTGLVLPELAGEEWWHPYLALSDEERPHCSNYTVAAYRGDEGELDIDFVLHRDAAGALEGEAAVWACRTRPGEELAILDQGTIFDPPADARRFVVVADETGLPGVRNILRDLPADAEGQVVLEVPTPADRCDLSAPTGVGVVWLDRASATASRPGDAALAELDRWEALDPEAYGYVVGESSLAKGGRRRLHSLGLPKDRITFSGYWRSERAAG